MAVSNRERVGQAIELLGFAFGRYVDQRMTRRSPAGGNWKVAYPGENVDSDASAIIGVILNNWPNVFRDELRGKGRSWLGEARDWRNDWAHNRTFSDRDTDRALETVWQLLALIDAPEAAKVDDLRRTEVTPEVPGATPQSPQIPTSPPAKTPAPSPGRSSKYDPLRMYLAGRSEPVIRLSFVEIEGIIGEPLTSAARDHRPWWANTLSHVQARAWMGAERRTANVDLNAATVDFFL